MKRILSWALVLVLLAAVCLTGCTKTPASSAAPASSAQPASSAAESKIEPLKQAKIQVWIVGPGKQTNSQKVWAKVNEILAKTLPNTTVEFTVTPDSEYKTNFQNMLAAQEAVDLAWVGYATDLKQDLLDNNLMELDALLDKYGANIKANLEQDLIDANRYEGKVRYIINWQSTYTDSLALLMPTEFVKLAGGDEWLKKANDIYAKAWKDPTVDNIQATYDVLAEYCQALVDNGKIYGGVENTVWNWGALYNTFGVRMVGTAGIGLPFGDDTFTVRSTIGTTLHRLKLKNKAEFFKKGYIASDILSKKFVAWKSQTDDSYNNNVPVVISDNALDDASAKRHSVRSHRDISIVRTNNPGVKSKGDGTAMAIPYCADEPERAMMFLNEVWGNKELYQTLIYGTAGEDYKPLDDGTIETTYGTQGNKDSSYGLWKWTIGTCRNAFTTQGEVKGYYDELLEKEKAAYLSPLLNFSFDKTNVDGIVSALADIDKKYAGIEYKDASALDKTIDAWVAERKAAGEDELIAEYQKQLNEYLKKNNITSWNYKDQNYKNQ